jgi:hypothetical protein
MPGTFSGWDVMSALTGGGGNNSSGAARAEERYMTFGGQGRLSPPQPTVALRRSASPARSPSSHGRSPTDESQQVDAFDDGAEDSDEDLFGEGRGEDAGPRSAAAGTAATANSEAAATSAGVSACWMAGTSSCACGGVSSIAGREVDCSQQPRRAAGTARDDETTRRGAGSP